MYFHPKIQKRSTCSQLGTCSRPRHSGLTDASPSAAALAPSELSSGVNGTSTVVSCPAMPLAAAQYRHYGPKGWRAGDGLDGVASSLWRQRSSKTKETTINPVLSYPHGISLVAQTIGAQCTAIEQDQKAFRRRPAERTYENTRGGENM